MHMFVWKSTHTTHCSACLISSLVRLYFLERVRDGFCQAPRHTDIIYIHSSRVWSLGGRGWGASTALRWLCDGGGGGAGDGGLALVRAGAIARR